jgi:hypothetical protein
MAHSNKGLPYQYLLALLPAFLTVGGWQAAAWAVDYFGCTGSIKDLQPCFAGGVDIMPAIGFGLFWCQMLSWICVPISGGKVLGVLVRQIAAHVGWRDLVLWPSAKTQDQPGRDRYRRRAPDRPA